jgi:hypothetical protein
MVDEKEGQEGGRPRWSPAFIDAQLSSEAVINRLRAQLRIKELEERVADLERRLGSSAADGA